MILVTFNNRELAQIFVDYMQTKGVPLQVEKNNESNFDISLPQSAQTQENITQVELALNEFIQNPYAKKFLDASWRLGEKTGFSASQQVARNNFTHRLWPYLGNIKKLTLSITLLCIVIFAFLLVMGSNVVLHYLGFPLAGQFNQIWRYITPIFIHFSAMHIIFNLMWWWYLENMIETRRSKNTLLEILLLSGIISNIAEYMATGPFFGGLSGVVYALMGYVWLCGRYRPKLGLALDNVMMGIAIIWLIAGFTELLGPIANIAHLVGLIVGLLLAAKDLWLINLCSKR